MNRFLAWQGTALLIFSAGFMAAVPLRAAGVTPNDTARFLAAMTTAEGSPLEPLTKEKPFIEHAAFFDTAWAALDSPQLSKIRAWSSENIKTPQRTLFYMFSGPDFLYANAFFPKAETYVMAGLELPGDIPDITTLPKSSIPQELSELRASLNSVFSYSFFSTKDMKKRLYGRRFNGILPVLFVFLARSGKTIESVNFVELDKNGELHPAGELPPAKGESREGQGAKGVKITFLGEDKQPQTLYYFSTDLSNSNIENSGFLQFCEKFGTGDSLLKSASYLPHSNNFSKVRSFLLTHSVTVVQDDTGIPLRNFDPKEWDLKPFGTYLRPISLFPHNYQEDLHNLFIMHHAPPLEFSIGYQWRNGSSNMLLAMKKAAAGEQAASDSLPEAIAYNGKADEGSRAETSAQLRMWKVRRKKAKTASLSRHKKPAGQANPKQGADDPLPTKEKSLLHFLWD